MTEVADVASLHIIIETFRHLLKSTFNTGLAPVASLPIQRRFVKNRSLIDRAIGGSLKISRQFVTNRAVICMRFVTNRGVVVICDTSSERPAIFNKSNQFTQLHRDLSQIVGRALLKRKDGRSRKGEFKFGNFCFIDRGGGETNYQINQLPNFDQIYLSTLRLTV